MTGHTQDATNESASKAQPKPYWTVTRAASKLRVSREHLSRVLNGQRVSKSLLRMYAALTGQDVQSGNDDHGAGNPSAT